MNSEWLRQSFNRFLKRYFDSCQELYDEMALPELTNRQFAYLKALDVQPSLTMSDLADQFNLAKPSVTELVKKFSDAGLVEKERSDEDQRVFFLRLTDLGRTIAKTNQLESERMVKVLTEELNNEELIVLKSIFDKIGKRYL